MTKKPRSKAGHCGEATKTTERETLLKSLRAHKQVVESEHEGIALKPGETHVFVKKRGRRSGRLVEKRKSFF